MNETSHARTSKNLRGSLRLTLRSSFCRCKGDASCLIARDVVTGWIQIPTCACKGKARGTGTVLIITCDAFVHQILSLFPKLVKHFVKRGIVGTNFVVHELMQQRPKDRIVAEKAGTVWPPQPDLDL